MAPAGCLLTRGFFREAQTPLLVMHGDSDQLVPFRRDGRRAFAGARRPRFLVRLEDGSHLGFAPIATTLDPTVHYDQITCPVVLALFGQDLVAGLRRGLRLEPDVRVRSSGTAAPARLPPP